jgi:hypothetical protein
MVGPRTAPAIQARLTCLPELGDVLDEVVVAVGKVVDGVAGNG